MVIIDGKEALEEDAISKLAPDRIKNFTILKDKSATDIYGERGKNGVLIITLLQMRNMSLIKLIRKSLMQMLWNWQKAWQKM